MSKMCWFFPLLLCFFLLKNSVASTPCPFSQYHFPNHPFLLYVDKEKSLFCFMFWSEAWVRDLVFILTLLSIPRERWLHCLNTRSCFPTWGLRDFPCRTPDYSTLFHWLRQANLFHHGEDDHRYVLTEKHLRPATPKLAKSWVICFELCRLQF